ncbi:unnamed protein product [Aphanomyces euteiches]
MSYWTDHAAQCLWLDSSYPVNKDPSISGVSRGSCPTTSGMPADVHSQYPSATVQYGNIRVGAMKPPTPSSAPFQDYIESYHGPYVCSNKTPTSAPTKAPTNVKNNVNATYTCADYTLIELLGGYPSS